MSEFFSLVDALAVSDLQVYLSRAGRVEDGSVRLVAGSGVLAAYTAILYPRGLMDSSPTVLGLRTFAIRPGDTFDAVVPTRSMLDRLARVGGGLADYKPEGEGEPDADRAPGIEVRLPLEVSTVTWAGISPPRGGWLRVGVTDRTVLENVAVRGIDEVAAAVPDGTGEHLVQRVRAEVWGKPIDGLEYVPAGAAFAAFSLGFLGPAGAASGAEDVEQGDEAIQVFETGPWTRLTTRRGHVLVRRQAWTLKP
jgi:hypothetical protein